MTSDKRKYNHFNRNDWVAGALELLELSGVENLKVVILAERLGVTSGSFYWHFKNRRQLLDGY